VRGSDLAAVRACLDACSGLDAAPEPLPPMTPPLIEAVCAGRRDCIELLLQRGASANARDVAYGAHRVGAFDASCHPPPAMPFNPHRRPCAAAAGPAPSAQCESLAWKAALLVDQDMSVLMCADSSRVQTWLLRWPAAVDEARLAQVGESMGESVLRCGCALPGQNLVEPTGQHA